MLCSLTVSEELKLPAGGAAISLPSSGREVLPGILEMTHVNPQQQPFINSSALNKHEAAC